MEDRRREPPQGSDRSTASLSALTFGDCQCRAPLIPQNVKTDRPIGVDIRMVDLRSKADLRWLERVVRRERNRKEENTARVW